MYNTLCFPTHFPVRILYPKISWCHFWNESCREMLILLRVVKVPTGVHSLISWTRWDSEALGTVHSHLVFVLNGSPIYFVLICIKKASTLKAVHHSIYIIIRYTNQERQIKYHLATLTCPPHSHWWFKKYVLVRYTCSCITTEEAC